MGHDTETKIIYVDKYIKNFADASHAFYGYNTWHHVPSAPAMSQNTANRYLNSFIKGSEVEAEKSVTIPLIQESDVIVIKTKVSLKFSAAEIATLRGNASSYGSLNNYDSLEIIYHKLRENKIPIDGIFTAAEAKLPRIRKAVAQGTEGKAITVYALTVKASNGYENVLADTYTSSSDARAAAIEFMNKDDGKYVSVSVEAHIQREGGNTELVVISRPEVDEVELTVQISSERAKPNAKAIAYLFATDYHF
jgi:hypothetical protein